MALDFTALRTEFWARGFDYLNDGAGGLVRTKRFLNDAMHMIDEAGAWPYLTTSTTGVAPLTLTDVDQIESVVDVASGNPLTAFTRGEVARTYADLTTTGPAQAFYVTGGTTINVYPVSTATLTVTYWRFGPDLSADTDTPLMPDRFRYAIVEYAVATALRDDESQDALAAQAAGDAIVGRMQMWADSIQPPITYRPAVGSDC